MQLFANFAEFMWQQVFLYIEHGCNDVCVTILLVKNVGTWVSHIHLYKHVQRYVGVYHVYLRNIQFSGGSK